MALSLFAGGLCLLTLYLTFLYFKDKKFIKQLKSEIVVIQAELKKGQHHESAWKEKANVLQHQLDHVLYDPVTQLLGWQLFEDRLNQSIKESERYLLNMAVILIHIDDMNMINHTFQQESVDLLLKEISSRLKACVRQVDSVSRFTKDTFAILLTQLTKPEASIFVTQRILQLLGSPFQIKEQEMFIRVHLGIALYPSDGHVASTLMQHAEQALLSAQTKGRHTYEFYQEKMHENSQRELTLYASLNRDSLFHEFIIYYQPIVDVLDETVRCVDALLHWQHPHCGMVHPQELILHAEKQRKLNVIVEWLLKNALRQFIHWRSLGFNPAQLGIAVTMRQLENSHFIYRISQILQEEKAKPEWLLLEIKESIVPLAPDVLEKSFNMLKYLGVTIAIDDFGMGSFSLWHLKNFPVHYLKLDGSFIEHIDQQIEAQQCVKALLLLVESLSMQLIIKGVESKEQAQVLKSLGCLLMQGQFLGEPLLENEVTKKMVVPAL